jgi:outer membrane protein OmpA-like peptidoglycan-associated protein
VQVTAPSGKRHGSTAVAVLGAVAFLAVGTLSGVALVQHDLTSRARTALADAGIDVEVRYRGLDAELSGTPADARQAADAVGIVAGVDGTRHVISRMHANTAGTGGNGSGTSTPDTPRTDGSTAPTTPAGDLPAFPDGRIAFGTGSADIAPDGATYLTEVAGYLQENPTVRLRVQGHADDTGSEDVNLALSRRRAQAVVRYLVGLGVQGDRLQAEAFGAAVPLAPNDTAEGRAANRRVELAIEEPS